jgi:hypothetical protein
LQVEPRDRDGEREKSLGERETYPRERESFGFLLALLLDPKLRGTERERERQNLREIVREIERNEM